MDFAQVILDRLKELDLNINQAEARYGFAQGYLRGVVRNDEKRATPGIDKAEIIATALGLEFRVGPPAAPPPVEHVTVDGADYTRIALHKASLSAGPGSANGDDVAIIDHLVFRQDWLRKMDVKAENGIMAHVSGDSMAPGIQPGDLVLIDKSRDTVPVKRRTKGAPLPPIFAFVQDGEARVKRIERPESSLLVLISDNPTFPPELLTAPTDDSFKILGQVVWSGHVWR